MENVILTDNEICQVIRDYIHEDVYQYAVMLDGEWGCGKSYFVDHALRKTICDEGRDMIYVSLYGIKSQDDIDNAVLLEFGMLKASKKISVKVPSKAAKLGRLVGKWAMKPAQANLDGAATDLMEAYADMKKVFFVFDDLERCSAPINEVLGYINKWVEHEGAKVLIVANEAECGRAVRRQQELQMMAAMMLKDYMPEKERAESLTFGAGAMKKVNHTLADIQDFAAEIFSQNEIYEKTKEKLIGKTIRYEAQLDHVVQGIVSTALNAGDYGEDIARSCIDAMKDEDVLNLRILLSALGAFSQILPIIQALEACDDVKRQVVRDVMNSVIRVSIRFKTAGRFGKWDVQWNEQNGYGQVACFSKPLNEMRLSYWEWGKYHFMSFRFVHEFICRGLLSAEAAREALKGYAARLDEERRVKNNACARLNEGCWFFTEPELQETIREMEEGFLANQYPGSMWMKVISTSLWYYDHFRIGRPEELCDHFEKEVCAGNIQVDRTHETANTEGLSEAMIKLYERCIRAVTNMERSRTLKEVGNRFNCFDQSDWSEVFRLMDHDQQLRSELMVKEAFAAVLDIPQMIRALDVGQAKDFYYVRNAFLWVYSGAANHFRGDLRNLQKLLKGVEALEIDDVIRREMRTLLCNCIKRFVEEIRSVK